MIFAIDPGSEKTGTAVVADDGSLVTKAIVPTPELGDYLSHVYENYPFSHIVMGDGTNHKNCSPWSSSGSPGTTGISLFP